MRMPILLTLVLSTILILFATIVLCSGMHGVKENFDISRSTLNALPEIMDSVNQLKHILRDNKIQTLERDILELRAKMENLSNGGVNESFKNEMIKFIHNKISEQVDVIRMSITELKTNIERIMHTLDNKVVKYSDDDVVRTADVRLDDEFRTGVVSIGKIYPDSKLM
jgi:prefoldin subunit 5